MPLTIPISLLFDLQTQQPASVPGYASSVPGLFQGSVRDFALAFGNANANVTSGAYSLQNLQGATCIITVSTTPAGDGSQTKLAQNAGLTWNAATSQFVGSLDLTSSAIGTAIGTGPSIQATIEFELVIAGDRQPIHQTTVTITAPADPGTVTGPVPSAGYLTIPQSDGRYVAQTGAPGVGFILTAKISGKQLFLYCNEDGSLGQQALN